MFPPRLWLSARQAGSFHGRLAVLNEAAGLLARGVVPGTVEEAVRAGDMACDRDDLHFFWSLDADLLLPNAAERLVMTFPVWLAWHWDLEEFKSEANGRESEKMARTIIFGLFLADAKRDAKNLEAWGAVVEGVNCFALGALAQAQAEGMESAVKGSASLNGKGGIHSV